MLPHKPIVAISHEIFRTYATLPQKEQNRTREFIERFRANPDSPSINYETIQGAADSRMRSVRISQGTRGIVLKPEQGNVYVLLHLASHDDAYAWAARRRAIVNTQTGSIQVFEAIESPIPAATLEQSSEATSITGQCLLFSDTSDPDLQRLGVPAELFPAVRSLGTEADLDAARTRFPADAYDALLLRAAGYTVDEVLRELERSAAAMLPPTDFAGALVTPESRQTFFVVEDEGELERMLNAPLEQWRVFLHASQRRLVERQFNGPVRVLGGAGTGKTVVAMHRARWLATRIFAGTDDRILFTTYTRNLAADIQANLAKICPTDALRHIEVVNLDAWVAQFLRRHGYEFQIQFGRDLEGAWHEAFAQLPEGGAFDSAFLRDEWEYVVQAQGLERLEEYLTAPRLGRGRRLSRTERRDIWPVFEDYRARLNARKVRESTDAMRDARHLLETKGDILPYRAIVVDEAQDMGPEAFRLLRAMIPITRPNRLDDLFFVGDGHQRIYGPRVVLSRCGVDIRGRSRKLYVNYRTTDEIRRWAVRLLEGRRIDDLDGGADDQRGYRSLVHGAKPIVKRCSTFREEVEYLCRRIGELTADGTLLASCCLVARTHALLEQYRAALGDHGVLVFPIEPRQAEDRTKPGLRIATLHRVKGLEFDHMLIAGVNEEVIPLHRRNAEFSSDFDDEEYETRERALFYVGATRARRTLTISSFGAESPLLISQ